MSEIAGNLHQLRVRLGQCEHRLHRFLALRRIARTGRDRHIIGTNREVIDLLYALFVKLLIDFDGALRAVFANNS
jgi:hypothetical protein